jgi:hypothetical protein
VLPIGNRHPIRASPSAKSSYGIHTAPFMLKLLSACS